jgi:hypothetical protein
VREQQMSINEIGTMARVNGHLAGFLERVILNGQLPGHYEGEGPERKFVRDSYETGAGSVNAIMGVPIRDEHGRIIGMTNPSINYRNPVDPTYFERTELMHYSALLAEVDQVDQLLASDQYVSAESRKTSRAGFVDSLLDSRATVNAAGRWMIEGAVRLALWLQGDRAIQEFEDAELRPMFNARINPGPATTETVRSSIELRTARGLSREGMQEMAGIEDTDAENARIAAEEADGVPWPNGNVSTGRVAGSLSDDRSKRDRAQSNGSRPDSDSAASRAAFGAPNQ